MFLKIHGSDVEQNRRQMAKHVEHKIGPDVEELKHIARRLQRR
jgi:hypothetical protein